MDTIEKLNAVNAHLEASGSEVRYWFTNNRFYICGNALSDADDISEVTPDRIEREYDNLLVTEAFLKSQGFRPDSTCPETVNRWEKRDGTDDGIRVVGNTYILSVTLNPEGNRTLYGCALFRHPDGDMHKHKFDEKALTIGEFLKFVDRNCNYCDLPAGIKTYPYDLAYDDLY